MPNAFYCDKNEMKQQIPVLNAAVSKRLKRMARHFDPMPANIIDAAPYRRNGGLRFLNCCKFKENKPKMLLNKDWDVCDIHDYLIQHVDYAKTSKLRLVFEKPEFE